MSRIVLTGFPDPPEIGDWCAVCVGTYKQALNEHKPTLDKITAAQKAGPGEVELISKPLGVNFGPLQVAVTWAPALQMQAIGCPVVPLCWTHAPALADGSDTNGKKVAPSGPIPGLTRGHG